MDYYIHPSHKGYGDQENQPHVHVCFGDRNDKKKQVVVSLITCSAIVTGDDMRYRHQKEAEDFTKRNLNGLESEWKSKAGNDW